MLGPSDAKSDSLQVLPSARAWEMDVREGIPLSDKLFAFLKLDSMRFSASSLDTGAPFFVFDFGFLLLRTGGGFAYC